MAEMLIMLNVLGKPRSQPKEVQGEECQASQALYIGLLPGRIFIHIGKFVIPTTVNWESDIDDILGVEDFIM
jgi:hypothetical protein